MSIPLYDASVPVFQQLLESLQGISSKAERHAGGEPDALLEARLSPDMFPFVRQVQIACDFAKGACARLAGVDVPRDGHRREGFTELEGRIARTRAFLGSLSEDRINDAAGREVVLLPGEDGFDQGGPAPIPSDVYLLRFAIPQFFFHVAAAYAILRQAGVRLGKMDYLGRFRGAPLAPALCR